MTLNTILIWIFILSPSGSLAQGVRFADGNGSAGRIEVFLNGEWGTVCDDDWDMQDALVVCRQLGVPEVLNPLVTFDGGQGPIHLDEVTCNGEELSLLDCPRASLRHDCSHNEDVGIVCSSVRLADGSGTAGRVEVFLNGQWGTVCDDNWDMHDASVVCRQLGLPEVLNPLVTFNGGEGPIHLDEVTCNGNESSLLDCPRNVLLHHCTHSEDVGLVCSSVRLTGGSHSAGRVEVFLNGEWGTVCDDNWDMQDASVVCRQLGAPEVLNPLVTFDGGQGPIHLDEVTCNGKESSLLDCPIAVLQHDCSHSEDVGIVCSSVRLADGSRTAGRVEVFLKGKWGTVCDDNWDLHDASVVCRQLGFPEVLNPLATFNGGKGPIHLDEVTCKGDESSLLDCPRNVLWHYCIHSEDVGVVCSSVRLVGGNNSAGRVEVFLNGEWGTVCDDNWDMVDAMVVCRQLGFPVVLNFLASYDEGQGPIHLDEVTCDGKESSLLDCPRARLQHDCSHKEDVGIVCSSDDNTTPIASLNERSLFTLTHEIGLCGTEGKVRLSGGNNTAGRVEICLDEKWGTVCDDGWDLEDAEVVCRELGFKRASAAVPEARFGEGRGLIHLDNSRCLGNETRLLSCNHSRISDCQHKEDASVTCVPFVPGEIRLAGGNSSAGRVEVYFDDQWGTVCDDDWDIHDATVVCRNIGFIGAVYAPKNAKFGEGEGLIHIDATMCKGDEQSLIECEYKRHSACTHHEDASVVCKTEEEMTGIPWIIPVILVSIFTALAICLMAYFVSRRKQKRKEEFQRGRNSPVLRPLPDVPIAPTRDNFVDTTILKNDKRLEKEDQNNASSKYKEGSSSDNNLYMSVYEGNNELPDYERMIWNKELD